MSLFDESYQVSRWSASVDPAHHNEINVPFPTRACVVAAGLCFLFIGIVSTKVLGHRATAAFDDLAQLLAALVAAVMCRRASVRATGPTRVGWLLLSLAMCAWSMGQIVWTFIEVLLGHVVPTPSLADVGFLSAVPLEVCAVVLLTLSAGHWAAVMRTIFDGLLIAGSVLLVSYLVVLRTLLASSHASPLSNAVSLAYPVGDALVATIVILALSRADRPVRRILALLGTALLAGAVSDGYYAGATTAGTYSTGRWLDAGWVLCFTMIAIAASAAQPENARSGDLEGPIQGSFPYLVLLVAVISGGVYIAHGGHSSHFLQVIVLVLMAFAAFGLIAHRTELQKKLRENQQATAAMKIQASRLREADLRWELGFEHSPTGSVILDDEGWMVRSNRSFAETVGRAPQTLVGLSFAGLVHMSDRQDYARHFGHMIATGGAGYTMESRLRHSDGRDIWVQLEVAMIAHASEAGPSIIVAQVQDVSDRRKADELHSYRILHDQLTDLPNGALLNKRIDELLETSQPFGVIYCGLSRFKAVNDSLGRARGDELLVSVAQRLASTAPVSCMVGRIAGDEFVLIHPGPSDSPTLQRLGEWVECTLAAPFNLSGRHHGVGVSIGITTARAEHRHADEVLREAHEAMLGAKARGRGRVEIYNPLQALTTIDELDIEDALRIALAEDSQLVAHYQPIVRLADEVTVGDEALVRWQHPQRGLLSPAHFLPVAERTGLVVPLGWRMLDVGCATLGGRGDGDDQWIAINVSASQLGRGQLVAEARRVIQKYGILPHQLHLEITESALVVASPEVTAELFELAHEQVVITLDDFGTGYSSLSLLRDLPVSVVKIDRSFVAPLGRDPITTAIVDNLIKLCVDLGIETVAEGIETKVQRQLLEELGCVYGQGYLFGHPAPRPVTSIIGDS